MGEKGSRGTPGASDAADAAVRDLSPLGGVSSRKMFGGFGLFHDSAMFGLVNSVGELFLKAGATNQARFIEAGATQHGKMPYFSVPPFVREDPAALIEWSRTSVELAHQGKKK